MERIGVVFGTCIPPGRSLATVTQENHSRGCDFVFQIPPRLIYREAALCRLDLTGHQSD